MKEKEKPVHQTLKGSCSAVIQYRSRFCQDLKDFRTAFPLESLLETMKSAFSQHFPVDKLLRRSKLNFSQEVTLFVKLLANICRLVSISANLNEMLLQVRRKFCQKSANSINSEDVPDKFVEILPNLARTFVILFEDNSSTLYFSKPLSSPRCF